MTDPAPRFQPLASGGGNLPPTGGGQKNRPLPKVLTKDQVRGLLKAAWYGSNPKRDRALLAVTYYLALRRSETVAIDCQRIDWERGRVRVWARKTMRWLDLPLHTHAAQLLRQCVGARTQGPAFVSRKGGRLSDNAAWRVFKRCAAECGIETEGGLHLMRHSRATHLLEAGNDIRVIQSLLKQADIRSTMTYVEVARGVLDRAAASDGLL